ncbi:hypothetical protein F66182_7325 [Fusarium sp. NRRL 66182]|nr:hypothetical protein F66182_7325 [Fusarium sp. NRRL 66182]
MVEARSTGAPFWALVRAETLKLRVSTRPRGARLASIPLARLESWTRGCDATVSSDSSGPFRFMRITIDSDGVCHLERLADYPRPPVLVGQRAQRFVIADLNQVIRITAYFRDGFCWLKIPQNHADLHVWDTPYPPKVSSIPIYEPVSIRQRFIEGSSMVSLSDMDCHYLRAVNLRRKGTTGLAFNLSPHHSCIEPYDIDIHTETHPWRPIERRGRQEAIYLPLPPGDEILWLQVRSSGRITGFVVCTPFQYAIFASTKLTGLQLETKLSGVVHIGYQGTPHFRILAFSHLPEAVICASGEKNMPVAFYPKREPSNTKGLDVRSTGPRPRMGRGRAPLFWSWAPLEDIEHVRVFQGRWNQFKGMLVSYRNGGQRFVGTALRDKKDSMRDWGNPSAMCVEILPPERGVRVHFDRVSRQRPSSVFENHELKGELHCWHHRDGPAIVRVLPSGSWQSSDRIEM